MRPPTFYDDFPELTLACPECGGTSLRRCRVEVWAVDREGGDATRHTIGRLAGTERVTSAPGISGAVHIAFWCGGGCNAKPVLQITQDKDRASMSWLCERKL